MSEIPGQNTDTLWTLLERQKETSRRLRDEVNYLNKKVAAALEARDRYDQLVKDMEQFLLQFPVIEGGTLLDRFHRERGFKDATQNWGNHRAHAVLGTHRDKCVNAGDNRCRGDRTYCRPDHARQAAAMRLGIAIAAITAVAVYVYFNFSWEAFCA